MSKILIVDNDKSSLLMTAECCKESHSRSKISSALSGDECLSIINKERFDLIIVDFDLPL